MVLRNRALYKEMGMIKCPVLADALIVFTNAGFNHLLRKGRKARTPIDQARRLRLLKFVRGIILDPRALCEERRALDSLSRNVCFWGLTLTLGGRSVTVVIRQVEDGPKHFFSVMDSRT